MKVIGIFAHPDDEIIFGWPVFQDKTIDRHLIICVADPAHRGKEKTEAVMEVCKTEGINLESVIPSDGLHYKIIRTADDLTVPIRKIDSLIENIKEIVGRVKPDYIFTHNFWGDNGNSEHKFISEIVVNHFLDYDILITNRSEKNSAWLSYESIPRMHRRFFTAKNIFKECVLDDEFYIRCKSIYDKYEMWTGVLSVPPTYPKKESVIYCLRK